MQAITAKHRCDPPFVALLTHQIWGIPFGFFSFFYLAKLSTLLVYLSLVSLIYLLPAIFILLKLFCSIHSYKPVETTDGGIGC